MCFFFLLRNPFSKKVNRHWFFLCLFSYTDNKYISFLLKGINTLNKIQRYNLIRAHIRRETGRPPCTSEPMLNSVNGTWRKRNVFRHKLKWVTVWQNVFLQQHSLHTPSDLVWQVYIMETEHLCRALCKDGDEKRKGNTYSISSQ